MYVCRLWEEVGLTRVDSCRHKENMQTPDRAQPDGGFKPLAVRQTLKGILKKLFAAVSWIFYVFTVLKIRQQHRLLQQVLMIVVAVQVSFMTEFYGQGRWIFVLGLSQVKCMLFIFTSWITVRKQQKDSCSLLFFYRRATAQKMSCRRYTHVPSTSYHWIFIFDQ